MALRRQSRKDYSIAEVAPAADPFRDFEGSRAELFVAKSAYFIRSNPKLFFGSLAAVAVSAILVVSSWVYLDQRHEQTIAAYDQLQQHPLMRQAVENPAGAAVKLEEFLEEHSGRATLRAEIARMNLLGLSGEEIKAGEEALRISAEMKTAPLIAFFQLQAAHYFEKAEEYDRAMEAFAEVERRSSGETLFRALALYGSGRLLVYQGRRSDGVERIRQMMEMRNFEGSEELRLSAAAFLLTH